MTLQSLSHLQILEELRLRGETEYNMLFEPNSSEFFCADFTGPKQDFWHLFFLK